MLNWVAVWFQSSFTFATTLLVATVPPGNKIEEISQCADLQKITKHIYSGLIRLNRIDLLDLSRTYSLTHLDEHIQDGASSRPVFHQRYIFFVWN